MLTNIITEEGELLRDVVIAGLDWLDDNALTADAYGFYRTPEGQRATQPTDRLIKALLALREHGRKAAAGTG